MKATPKLPAPAGRAINYDAGKEPTSDIEMLGAMLEDNQTMAILLRELPYERTHYRSNLRMVAGAAIRTRQRCERLLHEGPDPRADKLATTERVTLTATEADAAFHNAEPGSVVYVDEPHATKAESELAEFEEQLGKGWIEPNMDVHAKLQAAVDAERDAEPSGTTGDEETVRVVEAPESELRRDVAGPGVKAADVAPPKMSDSYRIRHGLPKNGAPPYTITESFIMGAIADAGAMTTSELLRHMVMKHSTPSTETNDALANLRTAGKVVTTRMGKGFINRTAE